MKSSGSIGIFDSGLGGLSVWRELAKLMPSARLIYLADSAYCPYGPRPTEEIVARSLQATAFLQNQGCQLIVVACNTATAAAIAALRSTFALPFVGMEPAIKPAAKATVSGVVGILATQGTLQGGHFLRTKDRHAPHIKVMIQPGTGLVEQVEQQRIHHPHTEELLKRYLTPMLEAGADQIVLGCTHYPFLIPAIIPITGKEVHLIDPAPAVARQTLRLAQQRGLSMNKEATPAYRFYTTSNISPLRDMVQRLLPMGFVPPPVFEKISLATLV